MDTLFIFGAKYALVISVLLWAIYLFRAHRRHENISQKLVFLVLSLCLTYLLGLITRHLYTDPRPFVTQGFVPLIPHAPDNGFPSDHALLVGALAAAALPYSRKLAISASIIAIFVAFSRVYVGVHHPIDVVGSLLLSLISTGIVYVVLKRNTSGIMAETK